MPKEIKIEPRFKEKDGMRVFDLPKGYVYLRLEQDMDRTLRLIAKQMTAQTQMETKQVISEDLIKQKVKEYILNAKKKSNKKKAKIKKEK